jgi:quinol-cytochrome oxidoreductase complex cytochrome b subunit
MISHIAIIIILSALTLIEWLSVLIVNVFADIGAATFIIMCGVVCAVKMTYHGFAQQWVEVDECSLVARFIAIVVVVYTLTYEPILMVWIQACAVVTWLAAIVISSSVDAILDEQNEHEHALV